MKMNGHFTGFRQLVQKLERTTPIISSLQDKPYERSFYGFMGLELGYSWFLQTSSLAINTREETNAREFNTVLASFGRNTL